MIKVTNLKFLVLLNCKYDIYIIKLFLMLISKKYIGKIGFSSF